MTIDDFFKHINGRIRKKTDYAELHMRNVTGAI